MSRCKPVNNFFFKLNYFLLSPRNAERNACFGNLWKLATCEDSLAARTHAAQAAVTYQVMPPSLSVGDTEELKRKSAHQLMQLSQLLMARDRELEELNEMVSLLKSQLGISGAEDAKEVLKAIEAHVRVTEGKLQQAVRETEVLKQGEEAAEQSVAEAMAAVEKVVATAEAAAAKAIAAAEKRATDAAADAAAAVAAAEEGAAKAIAAAEVWADEEIQEAKEKAEELVRQAQAEAAARRGDLEKVQSSAQSALEQQNKFLKQSEDALTRTQQKLKRADSTRSLLKKRDELMRIQEAIHRLQAMDMVPRLEPAPVPDEPEEKEEYEDDEDEEYEYDEDDEDDEDEDEDEEEDEMEENSDNPVRPRPLPRLAPQLGSRHWRLGTLPPRTYLVPSPIALSV
jgi:hypothetical protein